MKCKQCGKEQKASAQFNPWTQKGKDGKLTVSMDNICYKCNGISKVEVIKYREFIHYSRLQSAFRCSDKVYMARTKKNHYRVFIVNINHEVEEIDFSIAVLLNLKHIEPDGLKTELDPQELIDQLSRYMNIMLSLRRVY